MAPLSVVMVLALSLSAAGPAGSAAGPGPLELNGGGESEIANLMTAWATPVFGAPSPVELAYISEGGTKGRRDFASGESDFVVTGRPLTDEDNAALAARGVKTFTAPLSVAALSFLIAAPFFPDRGIKVRIPAANPDEEDDITKVLPDQTALKFENVRMARQLLDVGNVWQDPVFAAQFTEVTAQGSFILASDGFPMDSALRSDGSASNYYLQQFIRSAAPQDWATKVKQDLLVDFPAGQSSERWLFTSSSTRSGAAGLSSAVASWFSPKTSGFAQGGSIAPVSPSDVLLQFDLQRRRAEDNAANKDNPAYRIKPVTKLYTASMRNGAGEQVRPTPEAISAAAAAGAVADPIAGTPLAGLTTAVPNAWPLTWINNIVLPDRGLPVDKVNALAAFVRFAVTSGRLTGPLIGEGILPDVLKDQALRVVDQFVAANCANLANPGQIDRRADGGPYWPGGNVPVPGGVATFCVAGTPAPSTSAPAGTAAPARLATGASAASSVGNPGPTSAVAGSADSGVLSASATNDAIEPVAEGTPPPDAAAEAGTEDGGGSESAVAAPVAVDLPFAPPGDGRGDVDRLVTLLLGAATFFVLTRLVRGRMRRAA